MIPFTHIQLNTWTPREAERITSVDRNTQRDWRRRGLFPNFKGHARFNPFQLAQIWIMRMLSERGVPLKEAQEVAHWCAVGVIHAALQWIDAYEGDHLRTYEWQPDVLDCLTRADSDQEREQANESLVKARIDPPDPNWGHKARWLSRQILARAAATRVVPARFFIWWANDTHTWHHSVDAAYSEGLSSDSKFAGPSLILDQDALASTFLDLVETTLVRIEFEYVGQDKIVKGPKIEA